ncbi:MAG: ABC transporter substrate-binding protein [Calditrichaeota bacterium]|nr:ABC transporter substrate-binding protein [Calditrichota bacterium]
MNRFRMISIASMALVMACFLIVSCGGGGKKDQTDSGKAKVVKIGIVYTEPHPVLEAISGAFKAEILTRIPNAVFVEKQANGSKAQFPATVRSVLSEGVDLIAPITTPMSIEALKQAEGRVPVVFLGVTDPVAAGIVDSLALPGRCTGVSDNPPMAGVLKLVMQLIPDATTVGIPYDPKDVPGVVTAERAAAIARRMGINPILRPVASENDLRAAVRGLSSEVNALVIGMDNLMMKNAGIISRTSGEQGIPLFAADDKSVEMGAVAGVGVDYTDVGRLGADLALEILLDGKTAGSIPVMTLETGATFVNSQAADGLKISIPAELLKSDVIPQEN